jgi:dTMP kinase
MNTITQGQFITLEGIEGVGKSSNVQYVAQILQQSGKDIVVTREPGGTPIAEDIRKILLTEYSETTLPNTELLLLYAGRLQHVEHVIKPALAQGKWVICDRFTDATYAYQGGGRGIPKQKIDALQQWTLGDFAPDCTIILDAPVEIALGRIKTERSLDRIEKEHAEFFEKIRNEYLARAKTDPRRYHVVAAQNPLAQVQQDLHDIVYSLEGVHA